MVLNGVEIDKNKRYSNYYYSTSNRNIVAPGSKLIPGSSPMKS
jgi:hypothetical protein